MGRNRDELYVRDQKRGALLEGQYIRRYDGTILERSGPISKGDHSTYCGAKCSLGYTSLPPKTFIDESAMVFTQYKQ